MDVQDSDLPTVSEIRKAVHRITNPAPMRLAQIILPVNANDGTPVFEAHKWLESVLLNTYGGYSCGDIVGVWRDETTAVKKRGDVIFYDASRRYEIAMQATPFNTEQLRQIAQEAGRMALQLAVAVVLPSGIFEIINCNGEAH